MRLEVFRIPTFEIPAYIRRGSIYNHEVRSLTLCGESQRDNWEYQKTYRTSFVTRGLIEYGQQSSERTRDYCIDVVETEHANHEENEGRGGAYTVHIKCINNNL